MKTLHATFDNLPADCKAEIRQALVKEQQALCAYCMRRISASETEMKIEHWYPQAAPDGRKKALAWTNLLGVCPGGEGLPRADQTCDTRKGGALIDVKPTNRTHIRRISYPAAKLTSATRPQQLDIDERLNLNLAALVNARQAALDGALAMMNAGPGRWGAAFLKKKLEEFSSGESAPPFVGIVEHYLSMRLAKLQAS